MCNPVSVRVCSASYKRKEKKRDGGGIIQFASVHFFRDTRRSTNTKILIFSQRATPCVFWLVRTVDVVAHGICKIYHKFRCSGSVQLFGQMQWWHSLQERSWYRARHVDLTMLRLPRVNMSLLFYRNCSVSKVRSAWPTRPATPLLTG